ncbi:MAG: hypothetical protein EAZ95_16850 [Bacteroidetes bacterium]|nr:MAG: hypothetical protein EAZ95_16850 [Bacteroidota bacterium]
MMKKTLFVATAWLIALGAWYVGRQAYSQVQTWEQNVASLQKSQTELEQTLRNTAGELASTSQKRLLSYLQMLPPTIAIFDAVGKPLDLAQRVALPAYGLQARLVVPDTLQKMFPDAWKYETTYGASVYRGGYSTNNMRVKDNTINLMPMHPRSGDKVDVYVDNVYIMNSAGKQTLVKLPSNQASFIVQ